MPIEAVEIVRPVLSRTGSYLVSCGDRGRFVVKLQGNTRRPRILASEYLASKIGKRLGLTVPESEVVYLHPHLLGTVANTAALSVGSSSQEPLLHFGSRLVGDSSGRQCSDYLPSELIGDMGDLGLFNGILAFDKWCANKGFRQAVFHRGDHQSLYSPHFINHSGCFCGAEWSLSSRPEHGFYPMSEAYRGVTGLGSFEPFLSRIFEITPELLRGYCLDMPAAWREDSDTSIFTLVDALIERQGRLCELLDESRRSAPDRFPNWRVAKSVYPRRLSAFSTFAQTRSLIVF